MKGCVQGEEEGEEAYKGVERKVQEDEEEVEEMIL